MRMLIGEGEFNSRGRHSPIFGLLIGTIFMKHLIALLAYLNVLVIIILIVNHSMLRSFIRW